MSNYDLTFAMICVTEAAEQHFTRASAMETQHINVSFLSSASPNDLAAIDFLVRLCLYASISRTRPGLALAIPRTL